MRESLHGVEGPRDRVPGKRESLDIRFEAPRRPGLVDAVWTAEAATAPESHSGRLLTSNRGETVNGTLLHRVRIVLVEPTHPGNVGAVARAMKTMGLDRLCLVAPRRFPSAEATARAAGADDVLHAARVVGSLDEAIADCGFVLGTTARSRRIEWPVFDAREGARRAVAQGAREQVAVMFGRESAGLTNAEIDRCHALVRIPAASRFSSLNVAAAVQILAYEMRVAAHGEGAGSRGEKADMHGAGTEGVREGIESPEGAGMLRKKGEAHGEREESQGAWTLDEDAGAHPSPRSPAATAGDLEGFYRHLEAALIQIGYLDSDAPKLLMRRLRRLFNRAVPDRVEINILRGILTVVTCRPAGSSRRAVSATEHPLPGAGVAGVAPDRLQSGDGALGGAAGRLPSDAGVSGDTSDHPPSDGNVPSQLHSDAGAPGSASDRRRRPGEDVPGDASG